MFAGKGLNEPWYSDFFSRRIVIFGGHWHALGAVVQVRRCNVDRYVQCDSLRQPRSSPNVICENARDICTRDVQLI